MTVKYCIGWTEYWIINWLIFLLLDISTLEMIYALILSYYVKVKNTETRDKSDSAKKIVKDSNEIPNSSRHLAENEDFEEIEIIVY